MHACQAHEGGSTWGWVGQTRFTRLTGRGKTVSCVSAALHLHTVCVPVFLTPHALLPVAHNDQWMCPRACALHTAAPECVRMAHFPNFWPNSGLSAQIVVTLVCEECQLAVRALEPTVHSALKQLITHCIARNEGAQAHCHCHNIASQDMAAKHLHTMQLLHNVTGKCRHVQPPTPQCVPHCLAGAGLAASHRHVLWVVIL